MAFQFDILDLFFSFAFLTLYSVVASKVIQFQGPVFVAQRPNFLFIFLISGFLVSIGPGVLMLETIVLTTGPRCVIPGGRKVHAL